MEESRCVPPSLPFTILKTITVGGNFVRMQNNIGRCLARGRALTSQDFHPSCHATHSSDKLRHYYTGHYKNDEQIQQHRQAVE
ncbi:hypothetical protein ACTXT7_012863 [Hymenolepis weldensis]